MATKYRQYAHLSREWLAHRPLAMSKDEQNPTAPSSFSPPPVKSARGTHELFKNNKSIGLLSAEDPYFEPIHKGGHEEMKQHITNMGLTFHETHGRYGKVERSFIVHNPSPDQMIQLGRKFGQESVIHSQDGKHRLIYTNGPKYGKFHAASPDMELFHGGPPDDYFTAVPGGGHFRLHFDWDRLHDMPQHVRHPDMPVAAENPHAFNEMRPTHPDAQQSLMSDATKKSETQTQSLGNKPEEFSMSDNFVSVDDIRKSLAKSIKSKIDSYAKDLADLRKKELSKNLDPAAQTAQDPLAPEGAGDPSAFAVQPAPVADLCPLCHKEDKPGICSCLGLAQPTPTPAAPGMVKAELCKVAACEKNCGMEHANDGKEVVEQKKAEEWIDLANESTPGKRLKTKVPHEGVGPSDKKSKVIDTSEGSGGKVTQKAEVPMAKPPSGKIPGGKTPAPVAHNTSKPGLAKAAPVPGNRAALVGGGPLGGKHAGPDIWNPDEGTAPVAAKPAPKPQYTPEMHAAAKAKVAPKLPGMAPKAPAAMAAPPKPVAPAAAPTGPVKPAAKPALPGKPVMNAARPAAPAPAAPAAGGLMGKVKGMFGKSENFGKCALCFKDEHAGKCQ